MSVHIGNFYASGPRRCLSCGGLSACYVYKVGEDVEHPDAPWQCCPQCGHTTEAVQPGDAQSAREIIASGADIPRIGWLLAAWARWKMRRAGMVR